MGRGMGVLALVLFITSCNKKQPPAMSSKLIGCWTLDSATTIRGQIRSYREPTSVNSEYYTFLPDSSYHHMLWNYDWGMPYEGKFFVYSNPDRNAMTIVCDPGLALREADTVRATQVLFDVIMIGDSSMVTVDASEMIEVDSATMRAFNRHSYWSRIDCNELPGGSR